MTVGGYLKASGGTKLASVATLLVMLFAGSSPATATQLSGPTSRPATASAGHFAAKTANKETTTKTSPTVSPTITASEVGSSPKVSCNFPRGVCGFVDEEGRILIHPDYDWTEPFNANLARVKSAGMYGVIDRFGRIVVPTRWDYISSFKNGNTIAMTAGRYGVLDRQGHEVLAAKYAAVIQIADGLFLVDVSPPDPTTDGGRLEAEEEQTSPAKTTPGRWGLISPPDVWTIPPRFREVRSFADQDSDGPYWVKPTHKWQLISKRGNLLTGAVFDQIEPAIGGIAIVRTANRWNVVDASGKYLLPPDVEAVRRRHDDLVSYQHNGQVGVLGRNGMVSVPPSFDKIGLFVNDRASAIRNGVEVWIDVNGKISSPPSVPVMTVQASTTKMTTRRGHLMDCPDGLSLKLGKNGWTFVNHKQRQVITGTFTAARCFVRGTAFVVPTTTTQWIRIDRKGNTLETTPSCQLPDYASDRAGSVGQPPPCLQPQADSDASTKTRHGDGR